jgi:DNA ligase-4
MLLVLIGAYYGEGKGLRGKGISTFVCGVKDDRSPGVYHTVCKVGTGYSFDELLQLRNIIKEISVPWNPRSPPAHLAHWKASKKDIPNVYIPPEKSIVVQLKCAEIVPSAFFSAGMCCRFPRIQALRQDKPYTDIMSMRDLYELKQQLRNTTHVSSRSHHLHRCFVRLARKIGLWRLST